MKTFLIIGAKGLYGKVIHERINAMNKNEAIRMFLNNHSTWSVYSIEEI